MDLNAIKFEDKKQVIALKKKQLELNRLEEEVARLKRAEAAARSELNAMQNSSNQGGSGHTDYQPQRKPCVDKQASEEDQDKMRVSELLMQIEENNEEIIKNKDEINGLKVQIMTVLKQQQAEMINQQQHAVVGLGQLQSDGDMNSQNNEQQQQY